MNMHVVDNFPEWQKCYNHGYSFKPIKFVFMYQCWKIFQPFSRRIRDIKTFLKIVIPLFLIYFLLIHLIYHKKTVFSLTQTYSIYRSSCWGCYDLVAQIYMFATVNFRYSVEFFIVVFMILPLQNSARANSTKPS